VLSFNPVGQPTVPGAVGVPAPQTEIQIVDAIEAHAFFRSVSRRDPRARPAADARLSQPTDGDRGDLRGGWLHTGDIGEIDAQGRLWIRDRKKDMAIVGGYNVYPREIDEVLYLHPDVLEAAAVGVPDAYRGEVIKAFVVARPGRY